MTRWSRSRPLAAALALVFLAGCLNLSDGELAPFGTLEGPGWQPGFTWTWAAASQGGASYSGPEGTHESLGRSNATVTHRVDGTAPLAEGGNGIVVKREGRMPSSFMGSLFADDGLLLFQAGTLDPVARAYSFLSCEDPAMVRWHAYRENGPGPLVSFPVAQGDTWSGHDGPIAWKAQVLGEEPVTVPAGTFDAVAVHITAWIDDAPLPAPAADGPMEMEYDYAHRFETFDFSMKSWYAPAVQHIVRVDSHLKATSVYGETTEEKTDVTATLKLTGFDLEAAEGAAYAKYRGADPFHYMPPAVHITADTELPLNARDGTNVTFGLAEGRGDGIEAVEAVEAYGLPEEYQGHYILWTVADTHNRVITQAEGAVVTLDLPPGGTFTVRVRVSNMPLSSPPTPVPMAIADGDMVMVESRVVAVSPGACGGYSSMSLAGETFRVEWLDTYTAEVAAGPATRVEIGAFEAPAVPGTATATVQFQSEIPYVNDDHALVLVAPDGSEFPLGSGAGGRIDQAGTWTVVWDARGLAGNTLPTSLNVGHHATVDLRVGY